MCYIISLHAVGSTLCVVITISMYCIPISMCSNFNLFYVSYFKILCNCFLKFIVHKIVKSKMVKLTGREKTDMTNANVVVRWIL
jgi:hypothetical protein